MTQGQVQQTETPISISTDEIYATLKELYLAATDLAFSDPDHFAARNRAARLIRAVEGRT